MDSDIDGEFAHRRIRQLNDECRRFFRAGTLFITSGIAALLVDDQAAILERVHGFDAFGPDNDPYGEHDFGAFEHNGASIFWKIDYYDLNLECGSAEPWNPEKTRRVLTVLLASEY
jgi:hypothetical protein